MAAADWPRHVAELEDVGFTVVPGVFTQEFCARARAHMDDILAPRDTSKGGAASREPAEPPELVSQLGAVHGEIRARTREAQRSNCGPHHLFC